MMKVVGLCFLVFGMVFSICLAVAFSFSGLDRLKKASQPVPVAVKETKKTSRVVCYFGNAKVEWDYNSPRINTVRMGKDATTIIFKNNTSISFSQGTPCAIVHGTIEGFDR